MPRRASKRRISPEPSATLDQSSLRSRSSRKMLARSQSSMLVASRAIRSSKALRSRCEFIRCEMARMAARLSFNSGCGSELIGSLSLLYCGACVHKVDRASTTWTASGDTVRENLACVADNKRFTCPSRNGALRAMSVGAVGRFAVGGRAGGHCGGSPWPWYGALTASAFRAHKRRGTPGQKDPSACYRPAQETTRPALPGLRGRRRTHAPEYGNLGYGQRAYPRVSNDQPLDRQSGQRDFRLYRSEE